MRISTALWYSTTNGVTAPSQNKPALLPQVTIRADKPKQARDHKTSATNDRPTPGRKHKEVGEGHDKWHENGWEDVEPWIKIHPPSPAALRILIAGPLAEDSVGEPLHANIGRACRVF